VLGWKYVAADEDSQRYKVGKFILETKRVCRAVDWEREVDEEVLDAASGKENAVDGKDDDEIQFDSQDEDECEDLFAGIWSPQLAKRRRKNRKFLDEED